jgi:MoxR-like ATPase
MTLAASILDRPRQSAPARPTFDVLDDCRTAIQRLRKRLNQTLRGKEDVIELVLTSLLAGGHLLMEDRPGLGKTTLAKALAQGMGGRFARVQCTPDLLPADITGFSIFNQKTRELEFLPGPVFSDVLLADEINRATPRTQSALLEAMAERQVTVDNRLHQLNRQFLVIATQNPVESHGTYALPEAQLDRFAMKLRIGYPERGAELKMLEFATDTATDGNEAGTPDFAPGTLCEFQLAVTRLPTGALVREYLVALGEATRRHGHVLLGVSPRGLLIWQRLAQARALLSGRDFVAPADVQFVARPVLDVRLAIDHEGQQSVIDEILDSVPVPVYPR